MKRIGMLAIYSLALSGCLSSNVSHWKAFQAHMRDDLLIRRPTFIRAGEYMADLMSGRTVAANYLTEEAPGVDVPSPIPAGTPVTIKRIERRNLIDGGIEIVAHGVLRQPKSNVDTEFIFELTTGLGDRIRRAPWEDDSVPLFRPAPGS